MVDEIAVVLGTRPEIIKLAPVVRACARQDVACTVVHTGQHYSETLTSVFFEQLGLPDPDVNLGVGSGTHGEQTGEMIIGVERIIREERPDTVLVQGDTNSVLAAAIATSKMDVRLGHVEAGLRSFDRAMPEEINRVVADHVAESLFAPTDESKANLRAEGIPESRITVTGNTVVDALYHHRELARRESDVLDELGLEEGAFFLLTLHRAENVDDEQRFAGLLEGVGRAARAHDVPVVYPIHPRAEDRLASFETAVPASITRVAPQEYFDFLRLEETARLVLTDSGGVQEEACILGTPCVTLRDSTERPETLAVGSNVLAGHRPEDVVSSVDRMLGTDGDWENPFGDGTAAERILRAVAPRVAMGRH